jgi:hypothetical protein
MTDVSPLPTPHKNPSNSHSKHNSKHNKSSNKNYYDNSKDTDRLDMNEFYKAFNTDFNKKLDNVFNNLSLNKSGSGRSSANTYHNTSANEFNTSFEMHSAQYGSKIMRLDAENRRLLKKMIKSNEKSSNPYQDKPVRITSSALNRQKDQQRIERENQLILKRLLQVQPSKYLKKEEQLKDYERNFGLTSLNYAQRIAPRAMSSSSGFLNSTSSFDAIKSGISTKRSFKSSANNSRVSSAKSTAKSQFSMSNLDASEILKRTASASRARPEWSDRW